MPCPARLGWLLATLLLLACSRSSGGEPSTKPEPATSDASSSALGVAPSTEAPAMSAGPVLTPEDVEPDVERRITEQNLESELDRLEREIQAE